jgi:effector-binding domain-containing protein
VGGKSVECQCEVKDLSPQPTLSIRTRSSAEAFPEQLGEAFCAIAEYLSELGQEPAGPPFAAYYNMDMQDLDVEIGFPVAAPLPSKANIQASQVPGGRVASCIYVGPYSEMESAYETLAAWTAENGHEPTGVAYEMYLNDPSQTAPEALRTQIIFPLK